MKKNRMIYIVFFTFILCLCSLTTVSAASETCRYSRLDQYGKINSKATTVEFKYNTSDYNINSDSIVCTGSTSNYYYNGCGYRSVANKYFKNGCPDKLYYVSINYQLSFSFDTSKLSETFSGYTYNTIDLIYDSAKKVKVTFDGGENSQTITNEITYGEIPAKPSDPTKAGSEFIGWEYNSGKFIYYFDKPILEDFVFNARWLSNNSGTTGGTGGNNLGEVVSCFRIDNIPARLPKITSSIVNIIKIVAPLILIVVGMIDITKAITSQKDDEIKKGQKLFLKRLFVAVLIFFTIAIVELIV